MYYSASTGGFYDAAIHGDSVPEDVVEITEEEHATLLAGQSAGMVISSGGDGYPILAEPPAPTADQVQAQVNAEAYAYLASTDWYVIRGQETGEAIPADVLDKRAAARKVVVR